MDDAIPRALKTESLEGTFHLLLLVCGYDVTSCLGFLTLFLPYLLIDAVLGEL